MDFFNTNRFCVQHDFEQSFEEVLLLLSTSDDSLVKIQKIVKPASEDTDEKIMFHLSGSGKLMFNADGISQGMLKLTGNLPTFYQAISPMIDSNDAMILSMTTVADDGWISAKSAVVTQSGYEEFDLVGSAISAAAKMLNNKKYTTDTHSFE